MEQASDVTGDRNRSGESDLAEGDRLLAERCRQGEEAAFANLARLFGGRLYGLARRLTGSFEDAEDIVQETFIRAFKHRRRLDPDRGILPWLYTIATRLCLNHIRQRKRQWESHQAFLDAIAQGRGEDGERNRIAVRQALLLLEPSLRAAVVLVWIEGMTHREAGQALGCSEGTVSWWIFQAKEQLRLLLDDRAGRGAVESTVRRDLP